jgi:hypothetical protein
MKTVALFLFIVLLSCTNSSTGTEDKTQRLFMPTSEFDLKASGYTSYKISGFHILLENELNVLPDASVNKFLNTMEDDLTIILGLDINDDIKAKLLQVPIFIDKNTTEGAAVYHPSVYWLIDNGYKPEKAQAVEISNVTNYMSWTEINQPFMVLHELAHSYHDRVLEWGFYNKDVWQAYDNAVENGLYTNVNYHSGNGYYFIQDRAYALNNQMEFFAELTEAYFGLNDYFPFNKSDLEQYDSVGYSMIEKVWALQ